MKTILFALLFSCLGVGAVAAQQLSLGGAVFTDQSIAIAAQRALSDIDVYKSTPNGTTHAIADLSYCRIAELRAAVSQRADHIANLAVINAELLRLRAFVGLPPASCDDRGSTLTN